MRIRIALSILALTLGGASAWAHHSFAAEYDANKPITLKGTFTKMDWVNPHSWVYLDVKNADGKVENWAAETAPPNGLYRRGWRKSSLKEGDQITVEGFMAKDGSHTINARSLTTAEGKRLFAGSSGAADPTPAESSTKKK